MNIFQRIGHFFLDAFETIVLSLAIFVVIYFFVASPHQVKGLSMFPTFQDKELILTDKISYRFNEPHHGDVVVFKSPVSPEYDYIKRVIGVSGDKVRIEQNGIYINDFLIAEPYLPSGTVTSGGLFLGIGREVTVPAQEIFVMGDNRPGSSDSRAWGFVKDSEIIGKVFLRYFPFDKMGIIKNPEIQ
jgi:signal peptidase I